MPRYPAFTPFVVLGLMAGIHALLIWMDHTPRYLFGDSGSYLWSVDHSGPNDRSWTYPAWFLKPLLHFRSIEVVVLVQCALALVPPILCFRLVADNGRGSLASACVFGVLCVFEPLALVYQHFILADSLGAVSAAVGLYCCARALEDRPGLFHAFVAPPFMVLSASLRTSMVPSLALLAALVAFYSIVFQGRRLLGSTFLASLVLCQLLFSQAALLKQGTATYNASSGRFLLAAVLPIVSREDVTPHLDPAITPAIFDVRARNRRARPAELFSPGLAIDQIHAAAPVLGDETRLETVIALHAIVRAPLSFAHLTLLTYLDGFDPALMPQRVQIEAGKQDLGPGELAVFAENQRLGVKDTSKVPSLSLDAFQRLWLYSGAVPLASLIALLAVLVWRREPATLTLAAFALANEASQIAFATEPVPRYMIVPAWVNLVVLGRLASAAISVGAVGPQTVPNADKGE